MASRGNIDDVLHDESADSVRFNAGPVITFDDHNASTLGAVNKDKTGCHKTDCNTGRRAISASQEVFFALIISHYLNFYHLFNDLPCHCIFDNF